MKTATKFCLASFLGAGIFLTLPVMAQQLAQDAAVAAVSSAATMQVAAQGRTIESQARATVDKQAAMAGDLMKDLKPIPVPDPDYKKAMAQKEEVSSTGSIAVGASDPSAVPSMKDKPGKDKEDMPSPKVPDSIKGVIKRLNTATENVTLEDLNSAREAVAKLDILIDIEKRLNDLADLRHDREEKSLAGAIPASALGLRGQPGVMPVFTPPAMPPQSSIASGAPQMQIMQPLSTVEVQRITGAAGRFSAMIKSGEGKSTLVREGDKLPDGSVVKSITSRGLTLLRGNEKHTVQVKDVAAVFSGR